MIISKKKRFFQVFICSVLLAALLSAAMPIVQGANDNAHEYRYHFRRYTDNSAPLKHMYYHLYVPEDYDESLAYPLVIYLSLIGQDVAVNSMNYIDSSLLANGNAEKYPCIILIPLLPEDSYWVDNYFGKISDGLDFTMRMIDFICQEYSVDQRKIYISGMCFTATGAWDALFRYPDKFAAGVLVANIAPLSLAPKIPDVPLWIFNSDTDSQVPVIQSQGMVKALQNAGNTNVRYTEYKNYDHVEASKAPFWEEDLFPWMFSQTNAKAPFPEGKIPIEEFKKNPQIKDTLPDRDDAVPAEKDDNISSDKKTENIQENPIYDNKPNNNAETAVEEDLKDNMENAVNDNKTEDTQAELPTEDKPKDITENVDLTKNSSVSSQKKLNIWIMCIGAVSAVCLSVLLTLLYKKRFLLVRTNKQ